MISFRRLFDHSTLGVAVIASLSGCGSDDAKGGPELPVLTAGSASPAAVGGSIPAAVAGAPASATPTSSIPRATPTTGIAGASAPATAGAPAVSPVTPRPMAPGSAAPAAGAAAPAAGAAEDPNWDPKANLDANGLLIAPKDGAGFQLATPMFDLQPGQEIYKCYHVAVPNTAEFPVGEWDGQMSAGSHHFILYRTAGDTVASGTLTEGACTQGFGGSTWLYTQGSPRSHLQFPEGVAMTLAANERITFDLHYINVTSNVIHARVALNVNKVKAEKFEKADAQISFNIGIFVPPHGTQTVSGDCTPVANAKYFVMQTHTHKHATLAVVNRKLASGMMGEELVRTVDWENPKAHVWRGEPFLTFQNGETFHYSCTYQNDGDQTVTVGISADTNEMCMAEAYFFPASATTPMCN